MPKGNEGYFGIRLGEAIAGGAGHISDALRRKYEMQREDELRRQTLARQEEQQLKSEQLAFGQMGIMRPGPYPEEILSPLIAAHQRQQALQERKTEAEITKLGQGPKAPTDFRWTSIGELEPIPGSKFDIKEQETKIRKSETQQAFVDDIDNALTAIKGAKENVGYMSTGMFGGKLESTPQAGRLESYLRTINSLIGLDKLKEMKAQSATGASGFGQLSGPELQLLVSSVASLDRRILDPGTMKKNLDIIKDKVSKWKERTIQKMEQSGTSTGQSGNIRAPGILPGLSAEESAEFNRLNQKFGGR